MLTQIYANFQINSDNNLQTNYKFMIKYRIDEILRMNSNFQLHSLEWIELNWIYSILILLYALLRGKKTILLTTKIIFILMNQVILSHSRLHSMMNQICWIIDNCSFCNFRGKNKTHSLIEYVLHWNLIEISRIKFFHWFKWILRNILNYFWDTTRETH